MDKYTKSILTKSDIKKSLTGTYKRKLPILLVGTLFGLISGVGTLSIALPLLFRGEFDIFSLIPLSICLVGAAIIVLVVVVDVTVILKLVRATKSRFEVVEDELSRIDEEYVVRYRRHDTMEKVFYFQHYGRYVVTDEDRSAFDYSNEGDRFYVVIFPDSKEIKPERVYNKKVYKYEG